MQFNSIRITLTGTIRMSKMSQWTLIIFDLLNNQRIGHLTYEN